MEQFLKLDVVYLLLFVAFLLVALLTNDWVENNLFHAKKVFRVLER